MLSQTTCPHCRCQNQGDSRQCSNCRRPLVVGRLVSRGTGVIPADFVWEMMPRDLTLGRDMDNDFVVPSQLIAKRQLQFTYDPGSRGFRVTNVGESVDCFVRGEALSANTELADGIVLKVGLDAFKFLAAPEAEGDSRRINAELADHLQLVLGVLTEFQSSMDLQAVYENALTAVLRITHTQRGYVFAVEESDGDEVELVEVCSRDMSGPLGALSRESGYTVSQTVLREALSGSAAAVIRDATASKSNKDKLSTWLRLDLKSVICLPLVDADAELGKRQVVGIIYTDSFMPVGPLPKHSHTTLQLLAQIVSGNIVKWRQLDALRRVAIGVRDDAAEIVSRLEHMVELSSDHRLIADIQAIHQWVVQKQRAAAALRLQ